MRFTLLIVFFLVSLSGVSFSQDMLDGEAVNDDKLINWYDYPEVELRALDKVTAKATTFKVKVGKPAKFGKIYMKVQTCRKPPAIDKVESAAFVQVWEKPHNEDKSKWVFSGWMFASSPSLSAMDHPIYDVWVIDCIGKKPEQEDEESKEDNLEDGDSEEATEAEEPPVEEKSSFDSMLDSLGEQ